MKQKKSRKADAQSSSTGSSALGLLAVAAAAALGFWWWRKRQAGDGGDGGKTSGSRSAFKLPAGAHAAGSGPKGKQGNNKKKNKAQRREEKARRAEKREKAAEAPQQPGKADDQPASTAVINYSYYDSSRKDGIMPAARKRATLTAADAVQLQQEAAETAKAEAGSSGSGRKR